MIRYLKKTYEVFNNYSIDIVLFIFLTISLIKLTSLIENTDIGLYDESIYLDNGVKIFELPLSSLRAKIYCLWYYLIFLLDNDKVSLYFLNYKILVFLTTLIFFLYLRRLQVSPLLATTFSFLYLVSPIPHILPRPTLFALFIMLLFLIIATFSKSRLGYYCLVSLGILTASYARSEYLIAFIIYCTLSVLLIVRNINREPITISSVITIIFPYLIISSLLFFLFGSPLAGSDSFFAFGQHFSLNWVAWNHSEINPWTNWISIIESVFGKVTSPYEALISNPKEFFRHIFTNLLLYIKTLSNIFLVQFPNFSPTLTRLLRYLEALLFALAMIYLIWKRKIISRQWNKRTFIDLLIFFISISIAVLPSVLLIYPRSHYLMVQVVMGITIFIYLLSNSIPKNKIKKIGLLKILTICLFLFMLTPTYLPSKATPNFNVITFINKLDIKNKVNLFESEGGYSIYLGNNYNWIQEHELDAGGQYEICLGDNNVKTNKCDEKENFKKFAFHKQINMIVLSKQLIKDTRFIDDNEFNLLLNKPELLNFSRFHVPNTDIDLLVKNELLK
ncbi:hypothetical protein H6F39_12715 [Anabaena sp. FACHB-1250]|uniref:hypothetical protein n=1 Tax=Anabaena sp. FACHB-1250 TaxID=2692770 RepID=UPI001680EB7B|nr:hypothetical protein [Anabaena sp. FACHB-1250]MBD2142194.1 hypothetical protein [Anabaena sp. FACHB-1250]